MIISKMLTAFFM